MLVCVSFIKQIAHFLSQIFLYSKFLLRSFNSGSVATSALSSNMFNWKEQIVLITGASSGIGAGTALYLAGLGAKLALVARSKEKLENVAQSCLEAGSSGVLVCVHDLAVENECATAVHEAVKHFGGLSVLINNVGILHRSDFEKVSMLEINQSMNLHVNATVKICQISMPYLEAVSGSVVNVSSIAGLRAYPGSMAYKMSKAALDQFTRCLALEVAGKGVRVNSVNPGVIETDIFKYSGLTKDEVQAYYEAGKKMHPLGRVGQVGEVATAIAFLASADASFITGQTLAVDGGRSVPIPYAQMSDN